MSLNTVITPERECKTCHNVNFSSTSDGIILRNGREINQEWNAIGFKINATATTSAANPLKVRIFDTSNSTCIQATSTQEFGSPNSLCPGGGLGVGNGGAPGSDGENCNSIGNVLILQDPNTSGQCPVPNKNGGKMIFQFDSPVYFVDIGLLDADETQTRLLITYEDNAVETYKFTTFGDNSVQRVIVSKNNVIKFEVLFVTGSGAITDINYCTLCALQIAAKTNQGCIIAGNTVTNTLNLIELNDFEGDIAENSLQGWTYGTLNSNQPSNFTKFLGLYNQSNAAPHKTFSVPKNASAILFDLDFYMIDNWLVNEEIWIFVDEERIPIPISANLNPVQQMGNTSLGILWTSSPYGKRVNLGFLPYLDQKYHITIEIPASTNLYNDGNVRLLLRVGNTTTSTTDRYAGWDNIKVSARYNCEEVMSSPAASTVSVTPKPSASVMTPSLPDPSKFPTSTPTLITLTPITLNQFPTTFPPTLMPISSPPTKNPTLQPVTLLQALLSSVTATPTTTKPPTIAPTSRSPTTKPTVPPTLFTTPLPTSLPTAAQPTTSLLGILSFGILQGPTVKPVASPSPTKAPTMKVV